MPLVYGAAQRVADWVGQQCGAAAPSVDAAIGYESSGTLTAGVYFDGMLPNTIFAHIASAAPVMPRSLLQATCRFAFRQLRVERLTFVVSEGNTRVLDFVVRLGAVHEGRMVRAFGPHDALIYTFWRDCQWARRLLAGGRK